MTSGTLAARIAGTLRDGCTREVLPRIARDVTGLVMPDESPGSKSERVLSALKGKTLREQAEIARRLIADGAISNADTFEFPGNSRGRESRTTENGEQRVHRV